MEEQVPAVICPLCKSTYDDPSLDFCHKDGARLQAFSRLGKKLRGKILGDRYEVLRFLGAGGMAEVYEARQLTDELRVALKLLRPQISADPIMVERFKREAQLIRLIEHPNVVTVHDTGTLDSGALYMAMELLQGESLEELLERGPLDLEVALDVAIQACEGLQAAHDLGIVHRDVKPANIFLQDSGGEQFKVTVKILDLGIAKLNDHRASNLTATGMVFGSPEYMSPEQALGKPVDRRADLYSLGVVLFHAFTGGVPFAADSFVGVLTKQVTTAPQWPEAVAAERGLPEGLAEVILKALAKNPDHRYPNMTALRAALVEVRQELLARGPHSTVVGPSSPTAAMPLVKVNTVQIVALADSGRDLDREVVELAPDIYWVGRREGVQLERNIYLRVYRGNGLQINVLIDPGPPRDLSALSAKVKPIIGSLENVDILFLNHQDPDVASNAAVIQELNPRAHVICSEDTWRLAHFFGLRPKGYSAVEHFRGLRTTLATDHEVIFVPTPYCHFRGAVMYYDRAARILFSGDLFGGLSGGVKLVADEGDLSGIEIFHQLYMPSHRALVQAAARVRRLDPPPLAIAPQHGGVIGGGMMEETLSRVEALEVGADLFEKSPSDELYLLLINQVVELLVERVGGPRVAKELRCFSADGTFPNLFVFEGDHRIVEIKIESRAALRALLERVWRLLPSDQRGEFAQTVNQMLEQHHVQPCLGADFSPSLSSMA